MPKQTYGWAAGDAAYAMGSFSLGPEEALILEGRSPSCAFWNVCLWNPYMQTYDYRYERVTLNGGQVQYEPDGSWRIVVAARDPGAPNWVHADHPRGVIWFRWFLPESRGAAAPGWWGRDRCPAAAVSAPSAPFLVGHAEAVLVEAQRPATSSASAGSRRAGRRWFRAARWMGVAIRRHRAAGGIPERSLRERRRVRAWPARPP